MATPCTAALSDYNAISGFGTRLTGGTPLQPQHVDILPDLDGLFFDPLESEVAMENIVLASQVDEGNGFTRLGFTLTLRNNGPGYYEEMFIEWERKGPGWEGTQVGDLFVMPDLLPNSTTSRPQPFEVRVPTMAASTAIADILAGKHLRPIGIELHQMKFPTVAVDAATDAAFGDHETPPGSPDIRILFFGTSTPLLAALQSDTLLVESAYRFQLRRRNEGETMDLLSDVVSAAEAFGPLEAGAARVTQILQILSVTPQPGGGVRVVGLEVLQHEVMNVGTLFQAARHALDITAGGPQGNIYRPPFSDGMLSKADHEFTGQPIFFVPPEPPPVRSPYRLLHRGHPSPAYGFRPLHVPFNDISFAGGAIKMDGELLLDALNLEIKLRLRGNVPPKALVRISSKVELTMRLSAGANATNADEPEYRREKVIFSLPLPPITLPLGPVPINIQPSFVGRLGATIDTPTTVVIPVHGSFQAGCVMGWDGSLPPEQQFFYRPFHKSEPLEMTNPLLNDSLAFNATAFAEAGLDVRVAGFIGPYFGARVTGNFEVDPTKPKWWNLNMDFNTQSALRLKVLWINIADIIGAASEAVNVGQRDAGEAVPGGSGKPGGSPPGPFNPISGGETRWARTAELNAGSMKVARVAGTLEEVFAAGEANVVSPPIMRLGSKGELIWAKGAPFVAAKHLAGTADGGCVLVSGGSPALVVWLDGAGNPLAARTFVPRDAENAPKVFYLGGILTTAAGETYVAGTVTQPNFADDPFLMKFDASHNMVYFKLFSSASFGEGITGMTFLPGGDLVLCGISNGPTTQQGGLLMRVTPAGTLVWARRTTDAIQYRCVTAAPDGTLYAAGRFVHTVTLDWPALMVAKHEPQSGDLDFMVLIGESMADALPSTGFTDNGVSGDVIDGAGSTPYDEATKIAWTPNGIIVCGNTADLPNEATRAPMVMCLTERLGMRWFTTHDGSSTDDGVYDMVPTDQGIMTVGHTRRWGDGANGDPRPVLFSKIPKEGKLDLPGIAKYLQPSIMAIPPFTSYYPGIATPPQGYQGNEELAFGVGLQNLDLQIVAPPTFSDLAVAYSPPRQPDPSTGGLVATLLQNWRLNHFGNPVNNGLGADLADPDRDGLPNLMEYAIGSDPEISNSGPLTITKQAASYAILNFARVADTTLLYEIQACHTLQDEWVTIWSSTGAANLPGSTDVSDYGNIFNGRKFFRLRVTR
ncbi:MAG: hypothetical protein ACO1TE_21635 [Prosthecobacter sp.]